MPYCFNPFTGTFDLVGSGAAVTLTASQVAFGSSTNEVTSSEDFTYDSTTKKATIEGLLETVTCGDVSGASISLVDTGNGYSGESYTYNFKIYAYKSVGGTRVYSDTGFYISQYLNLGETYREFLFTITPVSGASGYVLVRSYDEGGTNPAADTYIYYKDITTATYQDGSYSYTNNGVEYNPTPTSLDFYDAPLVLNNDAPYTTKSFDLLEFGQGLKLQWQSANDYLAFFDENDALQTLRANISASTLTATTATLTSFSGAMTSGSIASAVTKPITATTFDGFQPVALSSLFNTNTQYAGNNSLNVNPSRKTITINSGATEIGAGVSGTMLSIIANTAYAAVAMRAGSAGGLHFFQIQDSSATVKAVFRDDGNALFGSTNYSNYGRATFIDGGFAGSPASGQLSTLAYYAQDDANVYGWGVGNRTYDINWQKVDVACQALNTGGGWIGTLEEKPIDIRVNKTQKAFEADSAASATKIGFYGATTITKPTVTGSRGGNAALASLCTALANLGLITNSTS